MHPEATVARTCRPRPRPTRDLEALARRLDAIAEEAGWGSPPLLIGLTDEGVDDVNPPAPVPGSSGTHPEDLVASLVGFDAPAVDGIANLRPTKSGLVWVQLCGRGMRLHPGKDDCLVADFTDTSIEMGPLDEIEGNAPKLKGGEAPTKICPECFSIILAGLKFCPTCGEEFIFAEHEGQQFDPNTGLLVSGVIKNDDGTRTYPVSDVQYEVRNTTAGAPALVAKYMSPGRATPVATEFLNLFHHNSNVANREAARWLRRQKFEGGSVPLTAQEALTRAEMGALRTPKSVTVKPGSPWPVRFQA